MSSFCIIARQSEEAQLVQLSSLLEIFSLIHYCDVYLCTETFNHSCAPSSIDSSESFLFLCIICVASLPAWKSFKLVVLSMFVCTGSDAARRLNLQ